MEGFVSKRRGYVVPRKIQVARRRDEDSGIRHLRICENKRSHACTVPTVRITGLKLERFCKQLLLHRKIELDETVCDGDRNIDIRPAVDAQSGVVALPCDIIG